MKPPNSRFDVSQPYSVSELRTKQAAASNRKGVVGRRGTTTPISPTAIARTPSDTNSHLLIISAAAYPRS